MRPVAKKERFRLGEKERMDAECSIWTAVMGVGYFVSARWVQSRSIRVRKEGLTIFPEFRAKGSERRNPMIDGWTYDDNCFVIFGVECHHVSGVY